MHAKRIVALLARVAGVALAATLLSACDVVVSSMNENAKAQDEWVRSYPITANGKVELVNTDGAIEVLATDGAKVEVRAERVARANTSEAARELLQQIEIKEEVGADSVRLETLSRGGSFGRRTQVRYYVKVPATVSVRVRNTNGHVEVDGVRGDVRLETTNGGVRGKDLAGTVEARSTNGGVTLDIDAVGAGGLSAETVNGGVHVTLPENTKADVRAECVHGGVHVSGLTVDGQTTRNRVEGRLNGGGPRVTLETTNGGISLSAGPSARK